MTRIMPVPACGSNERWDNLLRAFHGLHHVPKIKRRVVEAYSALLSKGVEQHDALEQALIDHAYYKDTRVNEYHDIMEGVKIWEYIQKHSGS
jgi:hypothetical protein